MNIENPSKEYRSEHNMVFSCLYHVIFCPKYRRSVLVGDVAKRLEAIVFELEKGKNFSVIEIEVMPDHVHMLIDIDPAIGIYDTVNHIKGVTSRLLRDEFKELCTKLPCLWTRSKFISSVGAVSLSTVKSYIQNQKNK